MRLLMTGATGFIGSALVSHWLQAGHQITAHVRDEKSAKNKLGPSVELVTDLAKIKADSHFDAAVNLAGAPIAGGLWTRARRAHLRESRVGTTGALVQKIAELENRPEVLISASAAGYYGRRGSEWLQEDTEPQDIFMSTLCRDWELAAEQVSAMGVRLVIPRISVVLGTDGGALADLVRPIRFGLGARFGAGDHYFPWIHKEDLLNFFDHMLENNELSGPVNAVAPGAVTQHEFNQIIAGILKRPNFMWVPASALKLLLGELSDLFVSGQRMAADKAMNSGFEFRYPTLEEAGKNLLK